MKRILNIAMPVLIAGTITAACQTVQTTQGGAVGVQRSQLMMVSAQEIEQASSQQYQEMLAKARRNYAAWGRTASVMDERVVGLMKGKGIDHYFRNGIEVSLKVTDPKEKAQVTVE